MAVIRLEPFTRQWRDWRRKGLDASDVFVLACWSEYVGFPGGAVIDERHRPDWVSTPRAVFHSKTGRVDGTSVTDDQDRGRRLAVRGRDAFNRVFQTTVMPLCIQGPGPVRVSLDGFDRAKRTLLEIGAPKHPWKDLPKHVFTKVHYQRAALDLVRISCERQGAISVFETAEGAYKKDIAKLGVSFDAFPIRYEEELGTQLVALAEFFWSTFVLPGKEPPTVPADVFRRTDKAWQEASATYRTALAQKNNSESRLERARKTLLTLAGGDLKTSEGFGVRVTTAYRRGKVDHEAALASIAPENFDVEAFRKDRSTVQTVTEIS